MPSFPGSNLTYVSAGTWLIFNAAFTGEQDGFHFGNIKTRQAAGREISGLI
jgi:hypothetical protein